MILWILLALLSGGVVLLLAKTETSGKSEPSDDVSADINVYIDQLDQIETDRVHGLLSEGEATSARTEVARRLLSRDQEDPTSLPVKEGKAEHRSKSTLLVLFSIPFVSLSVYILFGSPHLPSQPHASRQVPTANEAQIETLIEKVEARLREAPEDGTGWDVIAPIYLRLGEYTKASEAYQKASRLLGENPKRLSGLIQADILANNGYVTPEARALCERLLQQDPKRLEARLWLALAKEQSGLFKQAQADYEALLHDPNVNSDLTAVLRDRLAALQSRPVAEPKGSSDTLRPNLQSERVPSFTPEERQRIDGMVNGLATRLASEGQDVEGWTKLMRSYMVLGRKEEAQNALTNARQALATNAPSLAKIEAEALSLGLLPPREGEKDSTGQ